MPFDLQPHLNGQLLELRPLRAGDFDNLFRVASDPLIWEQHPDRNRYQEEVFRDFFRTAMESGGALIAIDARDGTVIGSSRYHGYDATKSEIEIGWTFLARTYWGGRYNAEMKRLMLAHAFRFVDRVIFLVGFENWRSQRAVEKIGGVRIGTRISSVGRESVAFEITAATFAQLQSTMEKVFEIYIKTSPERLWEAITNPELRRKYSFGLGVHSDWTPGSRYEGRAPQVPTPIVEGENLEVDPPRRLVQSFRALWSDDVKREGTSRVTWKIEPIADSCRLTVTHDQLRQEAHSELYGGWPMVLSGLKTLLETGQLLTTPGSLRWAN